MTIGSFKQRLTLLPPMDLASVVKSYNAIMSAGIVGVAVLFAFWFTFPGFWVFLSTFIAVLLIHRIQTVSHEYVGKTEGMVLRVVDNVLYVTAGLTMMTTSGIGLLLGAIWISLLGSDVYELLMCRRNNVTFGEWRKFVAANSRYNIRQTITLMGKRSW